MTTSSRAVVAALLIAATIAANPAHAASNAAIDALQGTPVTLLTYGLDALSSDLNGYLGRSTGKPAPGAVFSGTLSGPVADFATVLYDALSATITLNLIRIQPLDPGAKPDEACAQAFAAIRLYASLDPATGALQAGMTQSGLAAFFAPAGTPATLDLTPLDQSFRLRYNGGVDGKRFRCTGPLLGNSQTVEALP